MDITLYFLVAVIFCILIFAKMALVIIPQSETKIIERLGRYHATLNPGINIIVPFIDKAKNIVVLSHGRYVYSSTIDLREQVYDFPKQNVITKDNIQMEINALLYFQIMDAYKAAYEINNLPNAIEKLTQTTLRNIIGELELDETLTSRDTINTKLRARRCYRQVGRKGEPRRTAGHHTTRLGANRDGEADAGRAKQARTDPDVGGTESRRDSCIGR